MKINKQYEAEEILASMEQDVEVVPSAIAEWWIRYLHRARSRYMDLLPFLDNNDKKADMILEIGAVPGHFTVLLKRLGYNVTGVDIRFLYGAFHGSISAFGVYDVRSRPGSN